MSPPFRRTSQGADEYIVYLKPEPKKHEIETRLDQNQDSKEATKKISDNLRQAIATDGLQLQAVDARLQKMEE